MTKTHFPRPSAGAHATALGSRGQRLISAMAGLQRWKTHPMHRSKGGFGSFVCQARWPKNELIGFLRSCEHPNSGGPSRLPMSISLFVSAASAARSIDPTTASSVLPAVPWLTRLETSGLPFSRTQFGSATVKANRLQPAAGEPNEPAAQAEAELVTRLRDERE